MKPIDQTGASPQRKPEKMLLGRRVKAEYKTVALPAHCGNPLIEALPPRRSPNEVCELVRGKVPEYDPATRLLDANTRKDFLETLSRVFVTLPRHMRVEEATMEAIRNSYGYRNPMRAGYMLEQIEQVETVDFESQDYDEPMVGASCLIGSAGTGKTRILKRCLIRGCPQLIDHYDYQGKKLGLRQIPWIYISCAHDGSVKSVCEDIARVMDAILGNTDYVRRVQSKRNEHDKQVEVSRQLALHAVGLIVIDEFQNICVGRHVERKRLARFLAGLMEGISTRVMLVGTPEAQIEVVKDMPLMRRTIGEQGQIEWGRITEKDEWIRFLRGIWRYQYTATPTALDFGVGSVGQKIYELSRGIPDVAVKLYRMAQHEIIGQREHPEERIDITLLELVYKTRLRLADELLRQVGLGELSTIEWDKPENQKQIRGEGHDPEDEEASAASGNPDTSNGVDLSGSAPVGT